MNEDNILSIPFKEMEKEIVMYVTDRKTGNKIEIGNKDGYWLTIGFKFKEKGVEMPMIPVQLFEFYGGSI